MGITLIIILVTFGVLDYLAAVESAKRHLYNDFKNTLNFSKKIRT